ncbi:MAG: bifunctional phosphopantothenoylcysteine decarboxylase/phosphopantothenate--cysteine ligase CoaBC, partial [Cytophagales bacterium]|nr:bifunctional phosphopantothenoylcysteine decarboxylase/phosphopantothenate--cysteine ligase CoaBC [Armatimonadota bacterium]
MAAPASRGPLPTPMSDAPPSLPFGGKRIVLGVGGSISAYKAADLCSKLVQEGATVYPILTKGALRFVQPATFWGLAGQPVSTDTFEEPFGPQEIAHLRYAELADLFVIAPTSADLLAQIAHGFAGDMLTSALIANVRKPVLVAPAMNTDMWANPAVQGNRRILEQRGYGFIEPGVGRLAEGVIGAGRLAEPVEIVEIVRQTLFPRRDLEGLNVLVTAGPTREPIDPVRFLSNRSSGKMGYAIAEAAAARGARVTLVTGPTAIPLPHGLIETVRAETAFEMQEAVLPRARAQDVIVQSAAIADFRPAQVAPHKIKKSQGIRAIELVPTQDFSITLGKQKPAGQTLVGFAAETEKMEEHALAKLRA